jgi:hypothetical protein
LRPAAESNLYVAGRFHHAKTIALVVRRHARVCALTASASDIAQPRALLRALDV